MALDELQDQKPFGAHWSCLETLWRCEVVKKNTAHLFRNKFPVNYRSSWKEHFKFPGNLKPILGNESIVSLWRKQHYLSKCTKRWRGFPPDDDDDDDDDEYLAVWCHEVYWKMLIAKATCQPTDEFMAQTSRPSTKLRYYMKVFGPLDPAVIMPVIVRVCHNGTQWSWRFMLIVVLRHCVPRLAPATPPEWPLLRRRQEPLLKPGAASSFNRPRACAAVHQPILFCKLLEIRSMSGLASRNQKGSM